MEEGPTNFEIMTNMLVTWQHQMQAVTLQHLHHQYTCVSNRDAVTACTIKDVGFEFGLLVRSCSLHMHACACAECVCAYMMSNTFVNISAKPSAHSFPNGLYDNDNFSRFVKYEAILESITSAVSEKPLEAKLSWVILGIVGNTCANATAKPLLSALLIILITLLTTT